MGHRDAEGIHLSEENWVKISVDTIGFSSEKLIRALEAQMAGKQAKPQEGASLASGDLAPARRYWFQNWYRELGFTVSVPFPSVSDEEFNRRKELGQALFYRPPTSEVSYKALMKAVGQGKHWTVTDKDDRKEIGWEPTEKGYWFWAEVAEPCPRLGTPWDTLALKQKLNLLSLEGYMIVWWAHKADADTLLDTRTWSWLRTRFGYSALVADEYCGRVGVGRWIGCGLAGSYDDVGGRVAEVVKV